MLIPEECLPWIKKQRPDSDYLKELQEDFAAIEPFLPERVGSILDIGCGMGGISVLLKKKYPEARLELLDGDNAGDAMYGFNLVCHPYNSREATEAFLKANGVSCGKWHDVGTQEHLKADLVISLISWGFHYPLSTYKVSGFCVADLRKKREAPRGRVITETFKYNRCAFVC